MNWKGFIRKSIWSNPSTVLSWYLLESLRKTKIYVSQVYGHDSKEDLSNMDLEHCQHFVPLGMTPYSLVDVYRNFGEIYCFCDQGRSVIRENE